MNPTTPITTGCPDTQHFPPQMIAILPGTVYRHVCPTCGNVILVAGETHELIKAQ